jgi:hypothetical protein
MYDDDGFFDNDADLEMAELEAEGNRIAALRARGVCTHGWTQGARGANDPTLRGTPERMAPDAPPLEQRVTDGYVRCLHCGVHIRDPFYDRR